MFAIQALTDQGWLVVAKGGVVDGRNVSNHYALTMGGWSSEETTVVQPVDYPQSSEWTQPTSLTNSIDQLQSPSAPSLHCGDPELTLATKRGSVEPKTAQQELKLAWGDHLNQIITEAKACAGHYVSDDLDSLLRDAGDDDFADWIANKGPRIPGRAAQSRTETIGVLCAKRRTWASAA